MMRHAMVQAPGEPPRWQRNDGSPVSSVERVILDKNFRELQRMAQDTLDDAVLIGCSEAQIREAFLRMVDALANSYGPSAKQLYAGIPSEIHN